MKKIISIQQPEFMPWMGYFDKLSQVDKVIWLDDVQFKKRYFENRNKILGKDGAIWLRAPVITKGRYHQDIKDVEIDIAQGDWQERLIKALSLTYARAPFWQHEASKIIQVIRGFSGNSLASFNIVVIECLMQMLGMSVPARRSSEKPLTTSGSDLILDICRQEKTDIYLSGAFGREYLDLNAFEEAGIEVRFQSFCPVPYPQFNADSFVPAMSILDAICNVGGVATANMLTARPQI